MSKTPADLSMDEVQSQASDKENKFAAPAYMLVGGVALGLIGVIIALFAGALVPVAEVEQIESVRVLISILLGVAAFCGLGGMVLLIAGSVRWGMYGLHGTPGSRGDDQTVALLESINDGLKISETARRIAYRDRDLELLRTTIQDDIEKGDYDGALVLVEELSHTYGYREEAEDFRDQIEEARTAEVDRKVGEAVAKLDEVLDRKDFELGLQVATRIQRLFPDSPKTQHLRRQVIQNREQYKKDLEREFLNAAQRDDIERAMELLKELDKYLTEQEAEPLVELTKGVIGKKRDNLGVQFKMAVQDHDWSRAVQAGEQIIQEFPNTRMAEEVRGMIDLLRERAAGQMAAQPAK